MISFERSAAVWLALILLAVYSLTLPLQPGDPGSWLNLLSTHNLLQRGQAEVNQLAWAANVLNLQTHEDGYYPPPRPGAIWVLGPMLWLSRLPGLEPLTLGLILTLSLAALSGVGLFYWLRECGFTSRVAWLTALSYGLGTVAWLDARSLQVNSSLAATGIVAILAWQRAHNDAKPEFTDRCLSLSGLALGFGTLLGPETLLLGLGLAGLTLLRTRRGTPNPATPGNILSRLLFPSLAALGLNVVVAATLFSGLSTITFLPRPAAVLALCLPLLMLLVARAFHWSAGQPLPHYRAAVAIPAITAVLFTLVTVLSDRAAPLLWLNPGQELPHLHLALWPLILLFIGAANALATWQGHPPLMPDRVLFPLTLAIGLVFVFSVARVQQDRNTFPAADTLAQTLAARSQPDDILLVSLPPQSAATDALRAYLRWSLSRDHNLNIWMWQSETEAPLPPNLPYQTTNQLWLYEPEPSPAAIHLQQAAFIISDRTLETGRLTRFVGGPPAGEAIPLEVPFAGGLTLRNFAWAGPDTSSSQLKLRLTWQADDRVSAAEYVVFAQLLDPTDSGRVVAQQDRLLLSSDPAAAAPLAAGQTQSLGYAIPLPPDLPPGNYPLIVGLYQATTFSRIPRADNSPDDFLYLTTLQIP